MGPRPRAGRAHRPGGPRRGHIGLRRGEGSARGLWAGPHGAHQGPRRVDRGAHAHPARAGRDTA
eukprot:7647256-Lingulodinium_polyedra.AAC.1